MATITVKKRELIEIYNALSNLGKTKTNARFAYDVARNMNYMKAEIESINFASRPSEEFQKLEVERIELCRKMARKGPDGKPLLEGIPPFDTYVFDDKSVFDKAFEDLKKKHAGVFEDEQLRRGSYLKLLEDNVQIEFKVLKLKLFPEVQPADMAKIFFMIEEN